MLRRPIFRTGSSSDQREHGGPAGSSERFGLGEHVPDRCGEFAGELDAGDLGSALAAKPSGGALVVRAVGGMAGGMGGRLDERPAQVLGAVLG